MTILTKSKQDIKEILKDQQEKVALVPTMGSLHAGHISLIKTARSECKTVVVSVFVNPLQFGPNEDFEKYPRELESDFKICEDNSVDIVFAPSVEEIYPSIKTANQETIIPPQELTSILCGKTRKDHFNGVATVVKQLFDIVSPGFAYFGEKDLQQLCVIRWLVKAFNINTVIKACPTIREPSGLAYSSRNKYLNDEQKSIASNLYKSLKLVKRNIRSGIFTVNKAILESLVFLSQFPEIKVEYFEARDKENLTLLEKSKTSSFYCLIAAKVSNVRLIDNIEI